MKKAQFIFRVFILIFFSISCSSFDSSRKIADESWDSFSSESLLRWSHERITSIETNLFGGERCYFNDEDSGLSKLKTIYTNLSHSSSYWNTIGNCYYLKGSFDKAEFYYRIAHDVAKDSAEKAISLNNQAIVAFQFKQWSRGLESLNQAIQLAPQFRAPKFNLSLVYFSFSRFDKVVEILSKKEFTSSKDIDVLSILFISHLSMGDLISAEKYFSQIPLQYTKRDHLIRAVTYFNLIRKKHKSSSQLDSNTSASVPNGVKFLHVSQVPTTASKEGFYDK